MANGINDTLMLGGGNFPITDFVANQVKLGKILVVAFQNESLMSYALNQQIINNYPNYDGQTLAFLIPQGIDNLTSKTLVYFFCLHQ